MRGCEEEEEEEWWWRGHRGLERVCAEGVRGEIFIRWMIFVMACNLPRHLSRMCFHMMDKLKASPRPSL